MKIRIRHQTEEATTEQRFLAIARAVVTTTPAELAAREAKHEASKERRGVHKRGPANGTVPKHKRKD